MLIDFDVTLKIIVFKAISVQKGMHGSKILKIFLELTQFGAACSSDLESATLLKLVYYYKKIPRNSKDFHICQEIRKQILRNSVQKSLMLCYSNKMKLFIVHDPIGLLRFNGCHLGLHCCP